MQCSEYSYPNDDCFQFCQQRGLQRFSRIPGLATKRLKIDLAHIDARIKELDSAGASRAYQRQKTQLESERSSFLASFQPQKTLFSATPKDIVRFPEWKDWKSKTMVHFDSCQFLGLQGKQSCNCPARFICGHSGISHRKITLYF